MSNSAKSIFVFSFYPLILGVVLMAVPNLLLGFFGLPETNEVWIRIVGVLSLFLGYYYYNVSRNEIKVFFKWSIYARTGVFILFVLFVLVDIAEPVLILFGSVDAIGALWTFLTLKSEKE